MHGLGETFCESSEAHGGKFDERKSEQEAEELRRGSCDSDTDLGRCRQRSGPNAGLALVVRASPRKGLFWQFGGVHFK